MTTSLPISKLADIAELNPALGESVSGETRVSFVPMSAVSSDTADVRGREERSFREVAKGFTPFRRGDLLVAKITPCFENGKIAQATINQPIGFGSTEFHVVRPRSARVDGRYLLHFLRRDQVRLDGERRMTGSAGQRRVPQQFLADLSVPLPSLPEQRRIAAILDKADELRTKRRAALEHLNGLTQSIFLEMFGDPVTNPKGWTITKLGDLVVHGPQNGLYRPSSDYGSGVRILRIDAFYDGEVSDLSSLKRVRIPIDETELFGLSAGDIVINRVNSLEYLGKSAIIPALDEPVVFESNMMRLRVDTARAQSSYVIQALQTESIKRQIAARAKQAINQASVNQQDVRGLQMMLPPMAMQREFDRRCAALKSAMTKATSASSVTDELFLALQHQAFSGTL